MYIVYKTVNIVNDKIYIGVHNKKSDSYLGSGTILNCSIKKYGKENFKRETIMIFETKEEAYELEAHLVDKEFIQRKDTYNVKCGGYGGCGRIKYGPLSEEHKKKIRETIISNGSSLGSNNSFFGKKHIKETRDKISKSMRGRSLSNKHKDNIKRALTGTIRGPYKRKEKK